MLLSAKHLFNLSSIILEDAITALTSAPAKAVRLDHEIGSIAVGKKADLLLLTEDLELDSVYIDGNKII